MTGAPNRGFDERVLEKDEIRFQFEWDRDATSAAIAFLRKHRDDRFFAWLHLIDPHAPYLPPPPYDQITPEYENMPTGRQEQLDEITLRPEKLPDRDLEALLGLYDGQILATDRHLQRIFDALGDLGLDDTTLVIFTADHGEELYDHNRYFFHEASIYDTVLRVPLVVRLPGVVPAGRRVASMVELVDLLPTVLESQGLPRPGWIEGESLWPILTGTATERERKTAFFEWSPFDKANPPEPTDVGCRIFAVRQGRYKLISNPSALSPWDWPYRQGGPAFRIDPVELYDLEVDPLETLNLIEEKPEVAQELREQLGRWIEEECGKASSSGTPSDSVLRQLSQLGYVAPATAPAAPENPELRKGAEKYVEEYYAPAEEQSSGKTPGE